jgi:hypothetical protein
MRPLDAVADQERTDGALLIGSQWVATPSRAREEAATLHTIATHSLPRRHSEGIG